MLSRDSRRKSASIEKEKAALFSVGSIEAKLAFVLLPLLQSSHINLCCFKNYGYPKDLSPELIQEIGILLRETKITSVVFDLRIRYGEGTSHLKRSRSFSLALQDLCKNMGLSFSIILSNGSLIIGNAVGTLTEKTEASLVLRGEGPPDLTKFALEIGADFLLMTKKAPQRIDAKKLLRDKIISGEVTIWPPFSAEKTTITSSKKGYIHHLSLDRLHALKSNVSSAHPGSGLFLTKKSGDWIAKGDDILDLYFPERQDLKIAQEAFQSVFVLSQTPPKHQPLILEKFGAKFRP